MMTYAECRGSLLSYYLNTCKVNAEIVHIDIQTSVSAVSAWTLEYEGHVLH